MRRLSSRGTQLGDRTQGILEFQRVRDLELPFIFGETDIQPRMPDMALAENGHMSYSRDFKQSFQTAEIQAMVITTINSYLDRVEELIEILSGLAHPAEEGQ